MLYVAIQNVRYNEKKLRFWNEIIIILSQATNCLVEGLNEHVIVTTNECMYDPCAKFLCN